jgi:hypothetical protein
MGRHIEETPDAALMRRDISSSVDSGLRSGSGIGGFGFSLNNEMQ